MGKRGNSLETTAVMATRARGEVATDTPQQRLWRTLDYFPTPPWATRAAAEILLQTLDPNAIRVSEPACGEGHMAGPLAEYFGVWPSDVHPHWRGGKWLAPDLREPPEQRDWLDDSAWFADEFQWIVTNPPFSLLEEFVTRGLARASRGVALLLRLNALEGVERHALLAGGKGSLRELYI